MDDNELPELGDFTRQEAFALESRLLARIGPAFELSGEGVGRPHAQKSSKGHASILIPAVGAEALAPANDIVQYATFAPGARTRLPGSDHAASHDGNRDATGLPAVGCIARKECCRCSSFSFHSIGKMVLKRVW